MSTNSCFRNFSEEIFVLLQRYIFAACRSVRWVDTCTWNAFLCPRGFSAGLTRCFTSHPLHLPGNGTLPGSKMALGCPLLTSDMSVFQSRVLSWCSIPELSSVSSERCLVIFVSFLQLLCFLHYFLSAVSSVWFGEKSHHNHAFGANLNWNMETFWTLSGSNWPPENFNIDNNYRTIVITDHDLRPVSNREGSSVGHLHKLKRGKI